MSQKCESPEMQASPGIQVVIGIREKQEQGWGSCRVLSIFSSINLLCLSYQRQDENQNFPFLTNSRDSRAEAGHSQRGGVWIYSNGGEAQKKLSH
jgi:hypothetical protein